MKVYFLTFLINLINAKQKLPFNAKQTFGNHHHFADGTNNITAIEILTTESVLGIESLQQQFYAPVSDQTSINPNEPDFNVMRQLFQSHLSSVRNHRNATMKKEAKNFLTNTLVQYLGEDNVFLMPFVVSGEEYFLHFQSFNEETFKGTNIIGILKGPRYGEMNDTVFIIGAHWDTVEGCPGVDDNGSGVVAVLELARLLTSRNGSIPFTVYFVLFDFEEYGLIGSYVFASSFIAPRILNGTINVMAMFNFDMVLNYNLSSNSQILSHFQESKYFNLTDDALRKSNPEFAAEIVNRGSKGDFITVLSRRHHDDHISNAIEAAFTSLRSNIVLKLYNFRAPLSKIASELSKEMKTDYLFFTQSDHRNFWYPHIANKNKSVWNIPWRDYEFTISAVTFTDTGRYRGIQRTCYHMNCDNVAQLSNENLEFLAAVIKTADISIDILIEQYLRTEAVAENNPKTKWLLLSVFLIALIILCLFTLFMFVYCSKKRLQLYNSN